MYKLMFFTTLILIMGFCMLSCENSSSPIEPASEEMVSSSDTYSKGVVRSISCEDLGGCTPGYWKNHLESWRGFDPYSTRLVDVFTGISPSHPVWTHLKDDLLLEALYYRGGKGELGAARIMMRFAVAALLNVTHPDFRFPFSISTIKREVRNRFDANERRLYLQFASRLDYDMNRLPCPLN
jgi:hypothetical protein